MTEDSLTTDRRAREYAIDGRMRTKKTFDGFLHPPGTRATWMLNGNADAKDSGDEEWFAWADGLWVRLTVEALDDKPERNIFEGTLSPPEDCASWTIGDEPDDWKNRQAYEDWIDAHGDEVHFRWAEGRHVRLTLEVLAASRERTSSTEPKAT